MIRDMEPLNSADVATMVMPHGTGRRRVAGVIGITWRWSTSTWYRQHRGKDHGRDGRHRIDEEIDADIEDGRQADPAPSPARSVR